MERSDLLREVEQGHSLREIARRLRCSPTNVRYWLAKHRLSTVRSRRRHVDYTDDDIRQAVADNISIAGVLRSLGRAPVGSGYALIRREAARLGLDTSHWKGKAHGTTRQQKRPLQEVLVAGGPTLGRYKLRLVREGVLENRCQICDLEPIWRGQPLTLRLDHINGIRDDNLPENIRLLCPNCDSQTETFCGRNKRL